MPHTISLDNLQRLARQPDHEVHDTAGAKPTTVEGTWGGRLMRNVKVALTDRTERNAVYRETKLDVLHSLRQIYGDEIGMKAFRAGVGRESESGGWETSMSHPLTGRHIANMLDAAREATTADGVAELLRSRIGDDGVVAAFRAKLDGCEPRHLLMLAKAIQAWPTDALSADTVELLRGHLADPETGVFHALARSGLAGSDFNDGRGARELLTTTDRQALTYASMTDPRNAGRELRGQHVQLELTGEFLFCKTNEFADQAPGVIYGGDKLHVSVHPDDVGKTWDIVAPILYENRALFHEFKVTDMRPQRDLPETPTPESARARRVLLGNQLTLYASQRPDEDPDAHNAAIARVVHEIDRRLDEAGIRPSGALDDSGHQIGRGGYLSYRNDQQGGLLYLDPNHPDYPLIKEDMKQQPLYRALAGNL